jgi:hypothetical protein
MDSRSVIVSRLTALSTNLTFAEEALSHPKITPKLRQKVYMHFGNLFNYQRNQVDTLLQKIREGQSLALAWETAESIQKNCYELLNECFEFLQGALVRSVGLDLKMCEIADALIADLSDRTSTYWNRFTIVGEEHFFAGTTDIIRLQFPEFTIWSLPIVGHEFGHFVGRELRKTLMEANHQFGEPFQQIVNSEGKPELTHRDESFLYEYFADLFATYALGPAFACASLFLVFKPGLDRDGEQHPSDVKRTYFILQALEKMNKAEGIYDPYRGIIDRLQTVWQQCNQDVVGFSTSLSPEVISNLHSKLAVLYNSLDESYSKVKYQQTDWDYAHLLAPKLLTEKTVTELLEPDITLSDVFNAAWICRLSNWEIPDIAEQINHKALQLCQEIIHH